MANGSSKKSRSNRADSFQLSNRRLREVVFESLRNGKNWGHILLSLVAALLMWGITQGWTPPFQYRVGYIPERDIVAAVPFEVEDEIGTVVQQRRAVAETLCIYNNDTYQLGKLQENLGQTWEIPVLDPYFLRKSLVIAPYFLNSMFPYTLKI